MTRPCRSAPGLKRSRAQKLGEAGWANRARGELGLVAFLQGDTNTAIVNLGQAIKVAETNGDTSSLVRWLTLFGHGFVELGRPEQAFDFYERALKVARTVPELQMPFMTLVGKADALVKVGRVSEAEERIGVAGKPCIQRALRPPNPSFGRTILVGDRRKVRGL